MEQGNFTIGTLRAYIVKGGWGTAKVDEMLLNTDPDDVRSACAVYGLPEGEYFTSINIALFDVNGHRVLVDTGVGAMDLAETLREAGFAPESIDWIIITHAHRDHIAGILDANGDFAFPNARYAMSMTEWNEWNAPEKIEQDTPQTRVWLALARIPERIKLIEVDGQTVVDGVTAHFAPGHTAGHLALRLATGSTPLLHIVDAAHSYLQTLHPEWSIKFDANPEQAAATRAALFAQAADEGLNVLAYHFPWPGLGTMVRTGGTCVFKPLESE